MADTLKPIPKEALEPKETPAVELVVDKLITLGDDIEDLSIDELNAALAEVGQMEDVQKLDSIAEWASKKAAAIEISKKASEAIIDPAAAAALPEPTKKAIRAGILTQETNIVKLKAIKEKASNRSLEVASANSTPAEMVTKVVEVFADIPGMTDDKVKSLTDALNILVAKITAEATRTAIAEVGTNPRRNTRPDVDTPPLVVVNPEREQAAAIAEQIDFIRKNGDKSNPAEQISDIAVDMASGTGFRFGVRTLWGGKWGREEVRRVYENVKKGVEKRARAENEKAVRTALEASGLGIMTQILEKNAGALGQVDIAKMAGDAPAEFNQLNANLMLMVDLGLIKEPAWFATAPKATGVAKNMVATFNGVFEDGDQDKLRSFYKARVKPVIKAFPTLATGAVDTEEEVVVPKKTETKPAEPPKAPEKQEDKDAAEFLKQFGLSEAQLAKGLTAKAQDQFADGTEMELLVATKEYTQEDVETTVLAAICVVKTNGKEAANAKRLLQTLFKEGEKK